MTLFTVSESRTQFDAGTGPYHSSYIQLVKMYVVFVTQYIL